MQPVIVIQIGGIKIICKSILWSTSWHVRLKVLYKGC